MDKFSVLCGSQGHENCKRDRNTTTSKNSFGIKQCIARGTLSHVLDAQRSSICVRECQWWEGEEAGLQPELDLNLKTPSLRTMFFSVKWVQWPSLPDLHGCYEETVSRNGLW